MRRNVLVSEEQAVNVVTGREERTIGVEVEFFNVTPQAAIQALRNAGLSVATWAGYTHTVTPQWKITSDVSVTGTGTGIGKGLELVSPPLTIDQMDRQLKIALDTLNELGAKVDKTCGVHVHHDIEDLNIQHLKNLYKIYDKHNGHIDELFPASRRKANRPRYCKGLDTYLMDQIERASSIQELRSVAFDRYYTLNFTAYVKYGTMEFRQHAGSTDFDKIINWVRITQAMIASAKKKKEVKPMTATGKKRQLEAFNAEVGIGYTVQGLFSRDRRLEIKNAEKRKADRRAERTA
jgi:hypothetical protein